MGKHVLVPVDGSDDSWDAFEFALEEHGEETLTVLHVVNPLEGDYEPGESNGQAVRRSERIEQEVQERLREGGLEDAPVDVVIEEGQPADEIVTYADTGGVDQVVIGSRGLSGVRRLLLGSVAETVVRRADIPVTIVR